MSPPLCRNHYHKATRDLTLNSTITPPPPPFPWGPTEAPKSPCPTAPPNLTPTPASSESQPSQGSSVLLPLSLSPLALSFCKFCGFHHRNRLNPPTSQPPAAHGLLSSRTPEGAHEHLSQVWPSDLTAFPPRSHQRVPRSTESASPCSAHRPLWLPRLSG